jgi:hypothetical protein
MVFITHGEDFFLAWWSAVFAWVFCEKWVRNVVFWVVKRGV